MKRFATFFVFFALFVSVNFAEGKGPMRTWTDKTGTFSVDAYLISYTETSVELERADNGQVVEVPMEALSQGNQELIRRKLDEDKRLREEKSRRKISLKEWVEKNYKEVNEKRKELIKLYPSPSYFSNSVVPVTAETKDLIRTTQIKRKSDGANGVLFLHPFARVTSYLPQEILGKYPQFRREGVTLVLVFNGKVEGVADFPNEQATIFLEEKLASAN